MSAPKRQRVDGPDVTMEDVKAEDSSETPVLEERETDAPQDSRPKIDEPVHFLTQDMTVNATSSTVGNLLMTIKDGPMQYLCAGARCNVGVKSGRYAFEVKLIESLSLPDMPKVKDQGGAPKSLLRIGFSTQGSNLVIGCGDENFGFDELGNFLHNTGTRPHPKNPTFAFTADDSVVLVLNLDQQSDCKNTVSLFVKGKRIQEPFQIPAHLVGKTLYPTVSFKNVTVHTNFAAHPCDPLPFKCHMLEDAAKEDVVVTADKSDDLEILFPVFLPDKGTYDWCDWFMQEKETKFAEFSDRAIHDWAVDSGLRNSKVADKNQCVDKPVMGFGIPSLDDSSIKDTLLSLSALQPRSYVVMDVKGNLSKTERTASLKRFKSAPYKKVAQVMIGIPEEGFRARVHELILREKQVKIDKEFELKSSERAKQRAEAAAQRAVARKVQKAIEARRKAEALARQKAEAEASGEAGGTQDVEMKAENAEVTADVEGAVKAEETVEAKKEEVKEEESDEEKMKDDKDLIAPRAELTGAEKQINFRTLPLADLSNQAVGTLLNGLSLPSEDEGFDEVRFTWSSKEECEEHMRSWASDRKVTTRIDNIQPSAWFEEKYQEWQKNLQDWHTGQMVSKDPSAKANPKVFSKAPPQKPLEKQQSIEDAKKEDHSEGEKKEADDKSGEADQAAKDEKADDENKDPGQAFEEELDREYIDVFAVQDVNDYKGDGTPLFSNFNFEDWALLSLRFELHLLTHAFQKDSNAIDRIGIHPDHLPFYYNRYYKKALHPPSYGVDSVEELVDLVKDTVNPDARTKVFESMVTDDLESNDIFVKLTEEARVDRKYRLDAGDESARLNITKPVIPPGGANGGAAMTKSGASTPHDGPAQPGLVRPPLGIQPKGPPFAKDGGKLGKGKGGFDGYDGGWDGFDGFDGWGWQGGKGKAQTGWGGPPINPANMIQKFMSMKGGWGGGGWGKGWKG